jgi:hypothetical protein
MPNTHPTTGIAYGVLAGNNVPEVLDEITTSGTDVTYEEGQKEIKDQLEGVVTGVMDAYKDKPLTDEDRAAVRKALRAAFGPMMRELHYNSKKLLDAVDTHEIFDHLLETNSAAGYDYDQLLDELNDAGLNDDGVDESEHQYEHEWDTPHGKVKVQVMSLGGAPLIYVKESPYTARCAWCSPCCPHAGDLDTPQQHGIVAYCLPPDDMPDDWEGTAELLDAETLAKHAEPVKAE